MELNQRLVKVFCWSEDIVWTWWHRSVLNLGQFDTSPETCGNWLGLVNRSVYCARQTRDIYQVLPYSLDFKAPGCFEIQWGRQYLTSGMTVKLKSNVCVGLVNNVPNLWHCIMNMRVVNPAKVKMERNLINTTPPSPPAPPKYLLYNFVSINKFFMSML